MVVFYLLLWLSFAPLLNFIADSLESKYRVVRIVGAVLLGVAMIAAYCYLQGFFIEWEKWWKL